MMVMVTMMMILVIVKGSRCNIHKLPMLHSLFRREEPGYARRWEYFLNHFTLFYSVSQWQLDWYLYNTRIIMIHNDILMLLLSEKKTIYTHVISYLLPSNCLIAMAFLSTFCWVNPRMFRLPLPVASVATPVTVVIGVDRTTEAMRQEIQQGSTRDSCHGWKHLFVLPRGGVGGFVKSC